MKTVRVEDSSCTIEHPRREHVLVINGKQKKFVFEYGVPMVLPADEALKFNVTGFRLFDPETGDEFGAPAKTDETVRVRIGRDEVVAKYEELTLTALKMRAALLPNGEAMLDDKVEKEEVIDFLIGKADPVPKDHVPPVMATVVTGSAPALPDKTVMKPLTSEDISEI